MTTQRTFIAIAILFLSACTGTQVFGPQSPHAAYSGKLKRAGLADAALATKWFAAAERSFTDSLEVNLPYRETGFFAADRPEASAIRFTPKRGQKITIHIQTRPASGVKLFAELWAVKNDKLRLVGIADSSVTIVYEQQANEPLVLRIQPELLVSVSYTLTIVAEPVLAFPVPGNPGTRIGSFWGDARDSGKRKHEGIDIFDQFRTPVVAAADGRVTRVNENKLGGKTVWLNPAGKGYMLYYAHLDSQLVSPMQAVKRGDTLGLMGNTGNARNTPPHLHFGIYENGAVDPLPFVQGVKTKTPSITGDTAWLGLYARTRSKTVLTPIDRPTRSPAKPDRHTIVRLLAATSDLYLVELPDATRGFVPVNAVERLPENVPPVEVTRDSEVFAAPDTLGAVILSLPAKTRLHSYGVHEGLLYVRYGEQFGWVKTDAIERRR